MATLSVLAMDLSEVRRLGLALIAEHGLDGWRLELDRARRRAGVCRYDRSVIGLSAPLMRLYDEAEVRETILHEIAHALAGARAGHGPRWRAIARRIGSTGARCIDDDAPRVPGAWVGRCDWCGYTVELYRRPQRVRFCTDCWPGPNGHDHVLEWTFKGETVPMHPAYVAELAQVRRFQEALRSIETTYARVPVGGSVRITAHGRFQGTIGTVMKRGRTRYHVRIPGGVVTVPFPYAERVDEASL